MTCENPKIAYWNYYTKINEKTGEVYNTKEPIFINPYMFDENKILQDKYVLIPCGKCQGCQIDKANDWATRAYLESYKYKQNSFITLTYNNKNIPKNRTLIKKDIQDFLKRLRSKTSEHISYLCAGEYGPRTLRPHYHICIFNYWPQDAKFYKKNITGDYLYTSKELETTWGKGFIILGKFNYETAAYVARYTFKKAYGINKEWHLKHNRTPEFTLASKKPAIGLCAFQNGKLWEQIKRNFCIFVHTKDGLKTKRIPQYLIRKWRELDDRIEYDQKSETRAHALKQNARARDTDLNPMQYLRQKIETQKIKLKKLDKRTDL